MARGPLFYYLLQDILLELDPSAFSTGDRWMDLLRKIVLAAGARCSCSPDSEFALLREWLIQLGGECRCGDSIWSLYQRILTQLRLNSGLPNTSQFEFRAGDSLLDMLRKILNVLNAAPVPVPPEPPVNPCCEFLFDWGLISAPVTEQCDWSLIPEAVTCSDDWGALV